MLDDVLAKLTDFECKFNMQHLTLQLVTEKLCDRVASMDDRMDARLACVERLLFNEATKNAEVEEEEKQRQMAGRIVLFTL
jgi:hypothetical protein